MNDRFIEKVKKDTHYRIKLFLVISFIMNISYSAILLVTSVIYSSKWFLVTCVYYALLSIMRVLVFAKTAQTATLLTKIKTMRACGYFLLAINLIFSMISFIQVRENLTTKYHEIIVIVLATYTFTSLSLAIINLIKYSKKKEHVYSFVKLISLVSVAVSMVTLTNTMLSTFGEGNMQLRGVILPILSCAVSIFIIVIAVFIIVKANGKIKELKNEAKRQ